MADDEPERRALDRRVGEIEVWKESVWGDLDAVLARSLELASRHGDTWLLTMLDRCRQRARQHMD